jgi:hypothetical protein
MATSKEMSLSDAIHNGSSQYEDGAMKSWPGARPHLIVCERTELALQYQDALSPLRIRG